MNAYVWERLDNVTYNYHSQAGLLIIARTIEHAQELVDNEVRKGLVLPVPDRTIKCADHEDPCVFVFPDSGCC